MSRILVVGSEAEAGRIAAALATVAGPVRYTHGCGDGRAPLAGVEVVVLDGDQPGVDPLEAVGNWSGGGRDLILLSERLSVATVMQMVRAGAREILPKPVEIEKLQSMLVGLLEQRWPTSPGLARRIDEFVRRHVAREALCLREVGRQFNITPGYVSRLYRRYAGLSFRERLFELRIQRAKRLIEETDEPFYLVAERCGFRSPGRLTEAFRRAEGMPPKRYRELCRTRPRLD